MSSNFGIKQGYRCRPAPDYYSDTERQGVGEIVWQPEVYETAAKAARGLGCRRIIDIGCGSAEKLIALHPEFQVTGVDFGDNLEHCRERYPFGQWIEANLETAESLAISPEHLAESVIICSDVIEHLINPRPMLALIGTLLDGAPLALISTPERNLKEAGWLDPGPPRNPHHVREWTLAEMSGFARDSGLRLVYAGLTTTNTLRSQRSTILLGASGKMWPTQAKSSDWFPPVVNNLSYWTRVARKTLGEWRVAKKRTAAIE